MKINPEVGDIWYNHVRKYHCLIMAEEYELGRARPIAYNFLILDTGRMDYAHINHFFTQCNYVQ